MNTRTARNEQRLAGIGSGKAYILPSNSEVPSDLEAGRLWGTAGELIDNILKTHHESAWRCIDEMPVMLEKARAGGSLSNGPLDEIKAVWEELSEELSTHMRKEKKTLFPFIRDLELSALHSFSLMPVSFVTVANPMSSIRAEHERETELLDRLGELTNRLELADGVNSSLNEVVMSLKVFERNLRTHIRLENKILFPMAMRLEAGLYFE
jgi:regulator of cell morphogenesis and NO signaling